MMFIIQNLGSNPKNSWSTTTEVVIIKALLYLMTFFIV